MRVVLKMSLALMVLAARANAFSLLGPYLDWMQYTNGYHQPDDIGGPMDLGEEYRWNVPVVTYAFDQSFLDYFGSNGVAAVEQAVQMLNDLPPASEITVTNFPVDSTRYNYVAQTLNLYDLKSSALSALLEQMGLAEPTRHVFALRRWDPSLYPSDETTWSAGVIPYYIVERNFYPENPAASHWVNDVLLTGYVVQFVSGGYAPVQHDVVEVPVDALAVPYTAVADHRWQSGSYYTGLTRDDAGGLRYLLDTNNWNLETLLPGIHGVGPNAGSLVNQALRPGVDKVTFVRHDYDALLGQFFPPFTNQFTDTYITNNTPVQQQLERVITEPDFLFCAADPEHDDGTGPWIVRTGTSNWWNSGTPDIAGPGVIRPPVRITFKKANPWVNTYDSSPNGPIVQDDHRWGSFDNSTNAPIVYPNGSSQITNQLTVRFWLRSRTTPKIELFTWNLPVPLGGLATLQAATNLTDWVSLGSVMNRGFPLDWNHWRSQEQRFLRVVPE